jgi:hypothetical protein
MKIALLFWDANQVTPATALAMSSLPRGGWSMLSLPLRPVLRSNLRSSVFNLSRSKSSTFSLQTARQNPKALAQLDGYKRPLVGSLSANLQRFGMEKVAKMESLQEIIDSNYCRDFL